LAADTQRCGRLTGVKTWTEAEHYVKSYYKALPGAVLNASQMKTLALKILHNSKENMKAN